MAKRGMSVHDGEKCFGCYRKPPKDDDPAYGFLRLDKTTGQKLCKECWAKVDPRKLGIPQPPQEGRP